MPGMSSLGADRETAGAATRAADAKRSDAPVFLIDASVYVFRAWFSIPGHMADPDGWPVNALFGYAHFLIELLERERPRYIAAAFDQSLTQSFRNELFPQYKANREQPPDELERQFTHCRALTRALGIAEFASPEYEADDIIGTLLRRERSGHRRAVIVTRDKDLAQLLGPDDEFWDPAGGRRLAYGDIERTFGVRPEQLADFLALTGDAVDNIPGVPGVGRKTAARLLAEFETLDAVLASSEQLRALGLRGAARVELALREHGEAARLYRRLTGIHCDVPLPAGTTLRRQPPDLDALADIWRSAGFGSGFVERAGRLVQARLL